MSTPLTRVLLTASLFLLAGCAGAGYQAVPMPAMGAGIPDNRCRVYVARDGDLAGSIRNVRVFDGDTEIGVIRRNEFLCWERRAERGVGRLVFEGLGPDLKEVENVFDLPREPEVAGYFAIRVLHKGHRPEISRISEEEGRALIATRDPAAPK